MTILHGDCLEEMRKMADNSIDFIVTDPPYGLYFMGKHWDKEIPAIDIWIEALRVCKPGSMLAAFGSSRMHHHLMVALEQAGWEIRDVIMYLYGSGFPKSHNKFGLNGYGTALKPAYEPIILAMKPIDGTFAQNAEKWGVAGLNIDESRIETNGETPKGSGQRKQNDVFKLGGYGNDGNVTIKGRWPANIILDEEAAEQLDQMTGVLKSGAHKPLMKPKTNEVYGKYAHANINEFQANSGGASRFFYCAKASSRERGENNKHPTVKPIALMKYILKLLAPPGNPICLDPFAGSGSTLIAAEELNIECIGIEKEKEYCEIAKSRVAFVKKENQLDLFKKNDIVKENQQEPRVAQMR